jgi:protein-S-isoprenylcysteine O-methyltransferase Ste14
MATADLAKRALKGFGWFGLVLAAMIFAPAWSLTYWQGWALWLLFMASCLAITLYFVRRDPALIARRMQSGPTAEREATQKLIQTINAVLFCAIVILPSLDHRFGWSVVPLSIVVLGDCLVVAGFAIVFLVFRENAFASAIIEVSADQKVISTGLYAFVRHPMYVGAILIFVGMPLALGSWWGLVAAALLSGVMIWRLLDEERYLAVNLPGYQEYRRRVRWRLAPGVW